MRVEGSGGPRGMQGGTYPPLMRSQGQVGGGMGGPQGMQGGTYPPTPTIDTDTALQSE